MSRRTKQSITVLMTVLLSAGAVPSGAQDAQPLRPGLFVDVAAIAQAETARARSFEPFMEDAQGSGGAPSQNRVARKVGGAALVAVGVGLMIVAFTYKSQAQRDCESGAAGRSTTIAACVDALDELNGGLQTGRQFMAIGGPLIAGLGVVLLFR